MRSQSCFPMMFLFYTILAIVFHISDVNHCAASTNVRYSESSLLWDESLKPEEFESSSKIELEFGEFTPLSKEELVKLKKICGKSIVPKDKTEKIFDSKHNYTAKPGQYPWMVQFIPGKHFCGGFLISTRHVLTAAHCFYEITMHDDPVTQECARSELKLLVDPRANMGGYTIMIGGIRKGEGQAVGVKAFRIGQFLQHGTCDSTNDIALLELDSPVPEHMIKQKLVLPVCLPKPSAKIHKGKEALTVAGWGKDPILMGTDLRYTKISLVKKCSVQEWGETKVKQPESDQFCTTETFADACEGDSGGPLIQKKYRSNRYEVIGVVSHGQHCPDLYENVLKAEGDEPPPETFNWAVNTDVRKHLSWIKKYTNIY